MCSSKSSKLQQQATIAKINGRPVLQPKSNQVPSLERKNSLKKTTAKSSPPPPPLLPLPTTPKASTIKTKPPSFSPPISPKLKSPRLPALKQGNVSNALSSSSEKVLTPRNVTKVSSTSVNKSKKLPTKPIDQNIVYYYSSSLILEAPGSIAAARREQVATMQEQRKHKIAHYGRVIKSTKSEAKVVPLDSLSTDNSTTNNATGEKRCSFITPSTDPIYVAYHDEEWGVPVHDDKMLLELLVLTGTQVGSDWTSVLKKRQSLREAFSWFDAEIVAEFNEKKIISISTQYGIDNSQVRGIVDNSSRILQVKREFGSFDKYLWRFVNNKPISTQYKSCNKIPVKTSKSESISKDMVKRGFRFVGPTVIHSFMQAAGLSNDHLITCPRHQQIQLLQNPNSPSSL
ncbi:hypothetical protein JCGZ_10993 [Jatropha curcas]|uniref:DNA-3-methyladenine glycosylase I n=1 Tax=Jatropha curcas TaxID=180498 RepID=A0A067KTB8_JATCU|nr:hypothetical protein JCGZ_10993 [Jatropha curcas]